MQTQTNIQFGSGVFTITPNAGNLAANPTPIRLKVLQEASIEFKGDLKKLFGQGQFAVATARGKIDVTGKAKLAAVDLNDINQIYWGQAIATGSSQYNSETHVPAASVTPTLGGGLTVVADQGVLNNVTGLSMIRVATAPTVGQYTFTPATTGGTPTAATYGFNAAETATSVVVSFLVSLTTGSSLTVTNQLMGYAPVCQGFFYNSFRGATQGVFLNAITLGMFSMPSKQEDFWVSDIDFSANCDASGTLGTFYAS